MKSIIFLTGILILPGYISPKSTGLPSINNRIVDLKPDTSNYINKTKWFWDFNVFNNREGWTIPGILTGTVSGGALWLTIQSDPKKAVDSLWASQVWGRDLYYEIVSPKGLMVPAARFNKIVFRLRNLSPETDGFVRWQALHNTGVDTGLVHFTMKPDCPEWQEVICHMDLKWNGTIDQIKIQPALMWKRGDIWIDWISIVNGEEKPLMTRPDICSDSITPRIRIPGITQRDFHDAFKVLNECLVTNVPLNGFTYPFLAPGGAYGSNWWQLDGSLNVAGVKWVNQKFVEDVMRGFSDVQSQNPDGRIDLWGGSTIRGEPGDVSSLPRFFEAAYDVARRSNDSLLQNIIYESMKKYLQYWFSTSKRDRSTGLITGVFEETFSNTLQEVGSLAPIDLNVAVAIGCFNTSRLAENLGKFSEADKYFTDFKQISVSINQYLWNEEDHKYYNYEVKNKKHDKRLLCTTFDPFLLGIAPPDRVEKLIPVLLNPAFFNWGIRPLTTIAKTEPGYVEALGTYDGRGWFGDIWTLRNLSIIKGLEDAGKHDLAAELAWSTIKTFNGKYCEYIATGPGSGQGVQRYGWSASQYIQAIIETLFGIDYDSHSKRLRIIPHIPEELMNQELEVSNLIIPTQNELRLDLKILQKKEGRASISIKLSGKLQDEVLEIYLPVKNGNRPLIKDKNGKKLQSLVQTDELKNLTGVRMPLTNNVHLNFE